jgi:fatty acid desaturase
MPILRTPLTCYKEQKMKFNVGSTDRILRIVVGLALIVATLAGWIGVWGWIGVVPLLTGIFKFCPAYTLLGMNTCPMEKK